MEYYKSLNDKPYESFHLYVERRFNHPIERVWAQSLQIGSWMSAHRLETIDGRPGHEGHFERVYPRNLGSEVPLPHYHLYGIAHIIPLKLIVLEVFPEKNGSYGKTQAKLSFDSLFFNDLGGTKTSVGFHMVDVHLVKGDEAFRSRRLAELVGVRELLESYYDNLEKLL
jgi:uncharacterized protein YndB with AHSA1/START domain